MRNLLRLLSLLLCLVPLSCGGDGGGGGSPTAPAPNNRLTVGFSLGALTAGAVQAVAISIDGREIARQEFGSGCTANCQINGQATGLSSGNHTVTLTIVRQNRASIRYRVIATALYTDLTTGAPRPINLESRTVTLEAGQNVTYTVGI